MRSFLLFIIFVVWGVAKVVVHGSESDKVTPSRPLLLSLPIELIGPDGQARSSTLDLYLGDDLRQIHREFCEVNVIHKGEDQINLFLEAVNLVRGKTHIPTDLSISSRVELPSGGLSDTLTIPLSNDSDLRPLLADLCLSKLQYVISTPQDCQSLQLRLLYNIWDVLSNLIVLDEKNRQNFVSYAQELVQNENLTFLVEVPIGIPTGLGNVLRGFITALSIHKNTKLRNRHDYILGNYSSILSEEHIYSPLSLPLVVQQQDNLIISDNHHQHQEQEESVSVAETSVVGESSSVMSVSTEPTSNPNDQVISFVAWRFLVLKSEEKQESEEVKRRNKRPPLSNVPMLSPQLASLFSPTASVDGIFLRSFIPRPTLHRILNAIKLLKFKDKINHAVENFSKKLIHPSLGITIRSWTAPHEVNQTNTLLDEIKSNNGYSQTAYEDAILKYLNNLSQVQLFKTRSIFIAFDNPSLVETYREFFHSDRFDKFRHLPILTLGPSGDALYLNDMNNNDDHASDSNINEAHVRQPDIDVDIASTHKQQSLQWNESGTEAISSLEKAAMEALVLSKTTFMLGNKQSSFLELAWWLGGAKQTVLHP